MIPRLKPYFGPEEIRAAFSRQSNAVTAFEQSFAMTFGSKYALVFPYGRSALYSLLKALSIKDAEIIVPAYTCVVVPHAIALSGNIPKFVDIKLRDYTMDLNLLEKAITPRTRVIIPTHLFGYPVDTGKVNEITSRAKQKIIVVQDCAHSFGAEFQGKQVCNDGDAAIFGLNISKYISSIFGGILTTNDDDIYEQVGHYRDKHFTEPSPVKQCRKLLYLMAVYVAFNRTCYGLVNSLEANTPLLDRFTKYYREGRIDFPADFEVHFGNLEARVGMVQLKKYPEIRRRRQQIAEYYNNKLQGVEGIELPPIVDGATYSHYVPRVKNRLEVMSKMRREGIQLGQLIEYSIPHMEAYRQYEDGEFPSSYLCSRTTINLPNYPGLTEQDLTEVTEKIKNVLEQSQ